MASSERRPLKYSTITPALALDIQQHVDIFRRSHPNLDFSEYLFLLLAGEKSDTPSLFAKTAGRNTLLKQFLQSENRIASEDIVRLLHDNPWGNPNVHHDSEKSTAGEKSGMSR